MTDWLQETYDRSPDKCRAIDRNRLYELASLTAQVNYHFGHGPVDVEEIFQEMYSPFISVVNTADRELYEQAAKLSGITVDFEKAKCGRESLISMSSKYKGKYDMGNFWSRFKELKNAKLGEIK